jgi:endonuclease YncB( thermonuclease family)
MPQKTRIAGSSGFKLPPVDPLRLAEIRDLASKTSFTPKDAQAFARRSQSSRLQLLQPDQTGLPFPAYHSPKTGELVNVHGRPLPPLVSPQATQNLARTFNSTSPPAALPVSPFQQGMQVSAGEVTGKTTSVFQRTPQFTEGMTPLQRAQFAAGRLVGDVASDATRQQWWRFNNLYAAAGEGMKRLAGGNKLGAAITSFAGVQAFGQASGLFDLTNPGEAFRPKGYEAAFPDPTSGDRRRPENLPKEFLGRYILGRGGRLLPYEQFSQERPDVSREQYEYYQQYLKGGAGKPMPPGSFDLGGLGVIKGTTRGINGPEVRFLGLSTNPQGVAAGAGTAVATASLFNPNLRQKLTPAFKGLGVAAAGYDFYSRVQRGQDAGVAAAATGAGVLGGIKGAEIGAKLGKTPVTKLIGGVIGGAIGATGAGGAIDTISSFQQSQETQKTEGRRKLIDRSNPVERNLFSANFQAQDFAANPIGFISDRLQGKPFNWDKSSSKPAPDQTPTRTPAEAEQYSKDWLLRASAERRLVRDPKTKEVRSVPRTDDDDGSGQRAELIRHSDADSYAVRVYNRKTGKFEEKNIRVANIDARETADHNFPGNRMIAKQQKEQGFASPQAVFEQGEKDKQAAQKLAKSGSVVYLGANQGTTHDRAVRTVASESGGKDVGEQLVSTGNAVPYEDKKSKKSAADDGSRLKIAQLQHAPGGSIDRKASADIRKEQTKGEYTLANTDLEGKWKYATSTDTEKIRVAGKLQNTDLQGRYKLADTDLAGKWKYATSTDTEKIRTVGKVRVAELGFAGEQTKAAAQTYSADRKVDQARVTGGYKLETEATRQGGNVRVAQTRAVAQLGSAQLRAAAQRESAQLSADAKIHSATTAANARVYQAETQSSAKRTAALTKAMTPQMFKFW